MLLRAPNVPDTLAHGDVRPVAACQGGRLVVHFTNRKNAPFLFFHTTRDTTSVCSWEGTGSRPDVRPPAAERGRAVRSGARFERRMVAGMLDHREPWEAVFGARLVLASFGMLEK